MDFPENIVGLYLLAGGVVIAGLVLTFAVNRMLPPGGGAMPYRRVPVLSAAEKKFFRALEAAFPDDRYRVFAKVRLADLFAVTGVGKSGHWKHFSRISQKHLDFLVVDRKTLEPFCGIELDDSSHWRQERIKRDGFVNALFEKTAFPLHRFPAAAYYDPEMIRGKIGNSFYDLVPQ